MSLGSYLSMVSKTALVVSLEKRGRNERSVSISWSGVCERQKARGKKHNTRDSNVVPHRSTNRARCCLTSLSGREAVLSTWYGRAWQKTSTYNIHTCLHLKTTKQHRERRCSAGAIMVVPNHNRGTLMGTYGGWAWKRAEWHASDQIKFYRSMDVQQHQHNKPERQCDSTPTHQKHARAYMWLQLIEGCGSHQKETAIPYQT